MLPGVPGSGLSCYALVRAGRGTGGVGASMSSWMVPGFAGERELGQGASGRVVAAVSVVTGQPVAIKYLTGRLFRDDRFLARFRAEAELLRSVDVPQIVRFFDYAEAPGQGAAIIMELVSGVSLHEIIERNGATSRRPRSWS